LRKGMMGCLGKNAEVWAVSHMGMFREKSMICRGRGGGGLKANMQYHNAVVQDANASGCSVRFVTSLQGFNYL
jgi:hypothetical protein